MIFQVLNKKDLLDLDMEIE